jgi:septal ring-binding cell division protein DamX
MNPVVRLLAVIAVPAAFVLAGCGVAGAPAVPGVSQVDTPASVVVTTVPTLTTSVAPQVPDTPAAVAPPVVQAPVVQAPVQAAPPAACDGDYYVNSDGNCVHRPEQAPAAPAGATAKCQDGTYSFSQHRSGTCSHHGGVAEWL